MKCPNCGYDARRQERECPQCGWTLAGDGEVTRENARTGKRRSRALSRVMLGLLFAISICFFGLLIYRAYFWFNAWRVEHYYERNDIIAPEIEEMTLEDGRLAHAITFYGDDGDQIFIRELGRSYMISGGLTRIELADSDWFDVSPEDVEAAIITMTPVLHTEGGGMVELPAMTMTVNTPSSPLTLISPASEYEEVFTSMYPLQIQVVPGSTVLINGEDQTDVVDYAGNLSVNVDVQPNGENKISIVVSTANHRQTRTDIVLYRAPQSINLEPSLNQQKTSNRNTISIQGTTEAGAMITVDTEHVSGSVKVSDSGSFSFTARLTQIGDNEVRWHASMPGREDTYMSMTIYYVPSLNEYSRKAWKMDYEQLAKLTDTWEGRIFLCSGPVVDIIENEEEGGAPLIAMDVGAEGERQIVILENMSSLEAPVIGNTYRAYADVSGTYFYDSNRCPKLIARYILE